MKSTGKSTEDLFLKSVKAQLAGCSFPVRIICALSGGPDSTVLLLLLSKFAQSLNIVPEAAYVNHGIRAPEVLEEEDLHVRELCGSLNIPLYTKHLAPGFLEWYAFRKGMGTEAAAREYRYRFLDWVMGREDGDCRLALGHNRNDQEETMVMRLFSGAGLQGLQGIPRSTDRIIRPLIDLDRSCIEAYLKEYGIDAVQDESNVGDDYLRNRVRNRVLPHIREYFPSAGDSLLSLGDAVGDFLGHYRMLLENSCPWDREEGRFSCSCEDFLSLPPVSRRMVLLEKRNRLLKGRDRYQRIPASFLNPLDTMKGDRILKGYGILFYRKKDRLVLEDGSLKDNHPALFFHLTADYPYVENSLILSLEDKFDPDSGSPDDLVFLLEGKHSVYIQREEGSGKNPQLYYGTRALVRLTRDGVCALKGIKIEKRSDSGGFRGLPCVIIKERG